MKCINCVHGQVCRLKEHFEKLRVVNPSIRCKCYWNTGAVQQTPYAIGDVVNILADENNFYENKFYIIAASNFYAICVPVNNATIKKYREQGFEPSDIEGKEIAIMNWEFIFNDSEMEAYIEEYNACAEFGELENDDFFEEDDE